MDTLNIDRAQLGWKFWLIWMGASIAGVIVYGMTIPVIIGVINMLAPLQQMENLSPEQRWIGITISLVGNLMLGAAIGLGQWLVLRRYMPNLGWWILATAIGYTLPLELGQVMPLRDPVWLAGTAMFVTFGLALGILQWLVLRRCMPHCEWWIAFTLVGWLLAFALTGIAILANLYVEPFDLLGAFLVPIGTSGIGMVWLLRRSTNLSNVMA